MPRIIVEVDNVKNAKLLLALLKEFDFVKNIKVESLSKTGLPIEWAQKDTEITSIRGIWANKGFENIDVVKELKDIRREIREYLDAKEIF